MRYFVSAPLSVAINAQKQILFASRETEIRWSEKELENASLDRDIFISLGKKVLNQFYTKEFLNPPPFQF